MPPRDMYDSKGMNAKKKAEFEKWYDEQLNSNCVQPETRHGILLCVRCEVVESRV